MCKCKSVGVCVVCKSLTTLKEIIKEYKGIIADVGSHGDEHFATWWDVGTDGGVFNSLSVWPDNTLHFSQHYDGTLLRECHGDVSYLHDEVVWEWHQDGARCALSAWDDDYMWLFVAHREGELIRIQNGTIPQ